MLSYIAAHELLMAVSACFGGLAVGIAHHTVLDYDDTYRRAFNQAAVAILAFGQRLLHPLGFADIMEALQHCFRGAVKSWDWRGR